MTATSVQFFPFTPLSSIDSLRDRIQVYGDRVRKLQVSDKNFGMPPRACSHMQGGFLSIESSYNQQDVEAAVQAFARETGKPTWLGSPLELISFKLAKLARKLPKRGMLISFAKVWQGELLTLEMINDDNAGEFRIMDATYTWSPGDKIFVVQEA